MRVLHDGNYKKEKQVIEQPVVEEIKQPKPELKVNNSLTITLFILVGVVVGFMYWYQNKHKSND